MTILKDYHHFDGRHYETGSVQNLFAYQGVTAPHTGKPFTEAMLLGISGGITVGYFFFHYEGYDPQFVLLTRTTFNPMQTMLERMGVVQTALQTPSAEKGLANLLKVLEDGRPAIIFADMASLPYNAQQPDNAWWAMLPLVAYGHDGQNAYLADRSSQPLVVSANELAEARGRIKKEKYHVLSLDPPLPEKLPAAVQQGIWDCIRLFTEAPPRGSSKNFGLGALEHWAAMLTNTRNPQGWARYYPPGRGMFAALVGFGPVPGLYGWVGGWSAGGAERGRYAEFLDEAALLLARPGLKAAADAFRRSHVAWEVLAELSLPDGTPMFAEAKQLLKRHHDAFIEQGGDSVDERLEINARLKELHAEAGKTFPLSEPETAALRENMAEQVMGIHAIEKEAVQALTEAMD